ncbi:unnamed protein product [Arabidopsis arenosa]|uniref:RRM domain-containing protein n=1 Tax=Arabidopsis arenosa TaxID=38785 RepID=A0A8S2AR92_ARAAE|nr:unnamed protein product [Arabidopsis arenosa]
MDESADKGLILIGEGSIIPKLSDVGRIIVSGYDTDLPIDDVETALRNHFSCCGIITNICIPFVSFGDETLRRRGYIYFLGEGAVDKALQLNGVDVGGWNVSVKAYPFPKNANNEVEIEVEGFDTWLHEILIESALISHFSSYGKLKDVMFFDGIAVAYLYGKDVADKVTELNGSNMGGRILDVRVISKPRITLFHRYLRCGPSCVRRESDSSTTDAAIPKSSLIVEDKSSKKKKKKRKSSYVSFKLSLRRRRRDNKVKG